MSYLLSTGAEDDLRAVIRHTRQQWGSAQARRYAATLETGIARLAAGEGVFRKIDAIYPGLRVAHCAHHYIFCVPREAAPALIVAIFHERMDWMTQLADRLG